MPDIDSIPGIRELWEKTQGDPSICVAVLDGKADLTHECFEGAEVNQLEPYWLEEPEEPDEDDEQFAIHATHVASVIFGQHHSEVRGIAPRCRGLNIPVALGLSSYLSPLGLARAVNTAADAGANIIHIASCLPTSSAKADDLVKRAIQSCLRDNILVVAPGGNDRGECQCIPAAIPGVLTVGALTDDGRPFKFNNRGGIYKTQGVAAPGENIHGAKLGGGTMRKKGTSCAAPIVTGVAALLVSRQLQEGRRPDAKSVRDAILESARPCDSGDSEDFESIGCHRGRIDILAAERLLFADTSSTGASQFAEPSAARDEKVETTPSLGAVIKDSVGVSVGDHAAALAGAARPLTAAPSGVDRASGSVVPAAGSSRRHAGLAYVIGILGYDFGTEARRDSFNQLMPPTLAAIGGQEFAAPANPFDARQMVKYLEENPSEARSLIWTLNLDLTPVYAIVPRGPFGRDVFGHLVDLLSAQLEAEGSAGHVDRVSLPGFLTGGEVELFSGQVIPVLTPDGTRGAFGWEVNALIDAGLAAARAHWGQLPEDQRPSEFDESRLRANLRDLLNRIYYDLQNTGVTSADRALNFAATNIFQSVQAFAEAIAKGKVLEDIDVWKSPYCRLNSDCWDIKLKFFDPENTRRSRSMFRFTVDVSDKMPVTLGRVVSWSQSA